MKPTPFELADPVRKLLQDLANSEAEDPCIDLDLLERLGCVVATDADEERLSKALARLERAVKLWNEIVLYCEPFWGNLRPWIRIKIRDGKLIYDRSAIEQALQLVQSSQNAH